MKFITIAVFLIPGSFIQQPNTHNKDNSKYSYIKTIEELRSYMLEVDFTPLSHYGVSKCLSRPAVPNIEQVPLIV